MERLTRARLSNLDKVLYPELGITKAQIIEYYVKVAPRMLPFLRAVREAPVSTPQEWGELATLRPFDHNIFNVPDRIKNPWERLIEEPQQLPGLRSLCIDQYTGLGQPSNRLDLRHYYEA